jgi:hypothetical protein
MHPPRKQYVSAYNSNQSHVNPGTNPTKNMHHRRLVNQPSLLYSKIPHDITRQRTTHRIPHDSHPIVSKDSRTLPIEPGAARVRGSFARHKGQRCVTPAWPLASRSSKHFLSKVCPAGKRDGIQQHLVADGIATVRRRLVLALRRSAQTLPSMECSLFAHCRSC